MKKFKPYEFWHPRLFEAPYYLYLLWLCLRYRLPPKFLAKANYALDHGEIGIGSKLETQQAFDQSRFLPSRALPGHLDGAARRQVVSSFGQEYGYPLVLKPDIGAVGKGVLKVPDASQLTTMVAAATGAYLVQRYTPLPEEYGVFVVRLQGRCEITGINKKHFPTVVGDGQRTLETLAQAHPRYTHHWSLFLRYHNLATILPAGESLQLSFIGSHTMGCKFTDDSQLLSPQLEGAMAAICDSQPGFNFGRLDVKCANQAEFQRGEFVVIEVNGVASLPTHMFDPENTLRRAYQIFFAHARLLVQAANEHRQQPMQLKSWRQIWRLAKDNAAALNHMHQHARKPELAAGSPT